MITHVCFNITHTHTHTLLSLSNRLLHFWSPMYLYPFTPLQVHMNIEHRGVDIIRTATVGLTSSGLHVNHHTMHHKYTIYHTPYIIHHISYIIYHVSYSIHQIQVYILYHAPYSLSVITHLHLAV
ncbi:hypothetical protein EON63_25400 [archaeon]|nr:MAG: hypothetical protein EON63_25400 [archaeon]